MQRKQQPKMMYEEGLMQDEQKDTASIEVIQRRIMRIRGDRVMLDHHLAELYGVETKQLKRAVRRNIRRFPPDFMFELTREEYNSLRSQIGTIKRGEHSKYLPMAFTEQGVAMLSSVLNSKRAIEVNILIMRAFIRLREAMAGSKELARKLDELEKRIAGHDESIQTLFQAIRQLMAPKEAPKKRIGFQLKEKHAAYFRKR
jgi:phage regulator Rha-like protein